MEFGEHQLIQTISDAVDVRFLAHCESVACDGDLRRRCRHRRAAAHAVFEHLHRRRVRIDARTLDDLAAVLVDFRPATAPVRRTDSIVPSAVARLQPSDGSACIGNLVFEVDKTLKLLLDGIDNVRLESRGNVVPNTLDKGKCLVKRAGDGRPYCFNGLGNRLPDNGIKPLRSDFPFSVSPIAPHPRRMPLLLPPRRLCCTHRKCRCQHPRPRANRRL